MRRLIRNIMLQDKNREGKGFPSFFERCTNCRERDGSFYSLCTEQTEKAWEAVLDWVEKSNAN